MPLILCSTTSRAKGQLPFLTNRSCQRFTSLRCVQMQMKRKSHPTRLLASRDYRCRNRPPPQQFGPRKWTSMRLAESTSRRFAFGPPPKMTTRTRKATILKYDVVTMGPEHDDGKRSGVSSSGQRALAGNPQPEDSEKDAKPSRSCGRENRCPRRRAAAELPLTGSGAVDPARAAELRGAVDPAKRPVPLCFAALNRA